MVGFLGGWRGHVLRCLGYIVVVVVVVVVAKELMYAGRGSGRVELQGER